jgi:8-oxo-dGTP pyrophosphatase MutT (NUDIX family)
MRLQLRARDLPSRHGGGQRAGDLHLPTRRRVTERRAQRRAVPARGGIPGGEVEASEGGQAVAAIAVVEADAREAAAQRGTVAAEIAADPALGHPCHQRRDRAMRLAPANGAASGPDLHQRTRLAIGQVHGADIEVS